MKRLGAAQLSWPGAEHPKMDRVTQSVAFRSDVFAWHAPVSLPEVLELRQRLPRAMYLLGDTAKGIRQAAYEVANGRATEVISLRNVSELNVLEKTGAGGAVVSGHNPPAWDA